jgi:hypothetical protein
MCFNTSCAALQKKRNRSVTGVSLRDKVRNVTLIIWWLLMLTNTVIQKKKCQGVWHNL